MYEDMVREGSHRNLVIRSLSPHPGSSKRTSAELGSSRPLAPEELPPVGARASAGELPTLPASIPGSVDPV